MDQAPDRLMQRRLDWAQLFFSSVGRLGRRWFLIAIAVLLAIYFAYDSAVDGVAEWVSGWVVYPVLVFCSACVLAKRLHDRGRSGWWTALILLAFVVAVPPRGFFDFLFALVLIWAAVELGAVGGEQGPNRFGPPPA